MKFPALGSLPPVHSILKAYILLSRKKTCNEIRIILDYDLTKNPVSEIMHLFISQERDIVSDPLMSLQY